jgi:hypothetical protein
MAISVDTVYQRVLAILNKEQRGYLTPVEFNLLANQAQMSIFEQYFNDISQFSRIPGNDREFSDPLENLQEKINFFQKEGSMTYGSTTGGWSRPTGVYKEGEIYATINGSKTSVQRVTKKDYELLITSPLMRPTDKNPIAYTYSNYNDARITKVHGSELIITGVSLSYIKKPSPANWNYTTVLGEALYNSTGSENFQLHPTEETKVVLKVLELAGLLIQDIGTYQVADKEDKQKIQQEKS